MTLQAIDLELAPEWHNYRALMPHNGREPKYSASESLDHYECKIAICYLMKTSKCSDLRDNFLALQIVALIVILT